MKELIEKINQLEEEHYNLHEALIQEVEKYIILSDEGYREYRNGKNLVIYEDNYDSWTVTCGELSESGNGSPITTIAEMLMQ